MNNKFEQHRSKLVKEGIIKALICGAIIGFSLSLITALVAYLLIFNGLWISIGVALVCTAIGTLIFYFKGFRPVTKNVAERMDQLGLEERVITMLEMENDDSYVAKRQREDAQEKIGWIKREQIKMSIFKVPVIALAIIAVFSLSMITMSALGYQGLLPFSPPGQGPEEEIEFVVYYQAQIGGFIDGDPTQIVLYGDSTTVVTAVADDGWLFKEWDDGLTDAERMESNVQQEMVITAIFEPIMGEQEEGDSDETIDKPGDKQGKPHPDGPPVENPEPGDVGEETNQGGEAYEDNNQIINGKIHYSSQYKTYYDQAMEILKNGGEIPAGLLKMINKYYDIISVSE